MNDRVDQPSAEHEQPRPLHRLPRKRPASRRPPSPGDGLLRQRVGRHHPNPMGASATSSPRSATTSGSGTTACPGSTSGVRSTPSRRPLQRSPAPYGTPDLGSGAAVGRSSTPTSQQLHRGHVPGHRYQRSSQISSPGTATPWPTPRCTGATPATAGPPSTPRGPPVVAPRRPEAGHHPPRPGAVRRGRRTDVRWYRVRLPAPGLHRPEPPPDIAYDAADDNAARAEPKDARDDGRGRCRGGRPPRNARPSAGPGAGHQRGFVFARRGREQGRG